MGDKSLDYATKYINGQSPFNNKLEKYNYRLIFLEGDERQVDRLAFKDKIVTGWYNVNDLEVDQMNRYNYYDLEESVKMVEEVVREESKRYHNGSENNIYLMGFSQGACLALQIAFKSRFHFAAVCTIGGMILPLLKQSLMDGQVQINPNLHSTKLLIYSGQTDPLYKVHFVLQNFADILSKYSLPNMSIQTEINLKHQLSNSFWNSCLDIIYSIQSNK